MKKRLMSTDSQREKDEKTDKKPPGFAPSYARMLLVMALIGSLLAGGVYLLNALSDARKAQECLERGRRNCNALTP
jgi:hypothetical protein